MAKSPRLQVVEFADLSEDRSDAILDPLFDEEIEPLTGEIVGSREEYGIDLDDAVMELGEQISAAVDFMQSHLLPKWEEAEEFFDGESEVPAAKGLSEATATVFRDAVRSVKPSAMRVFTQYPHIVAYKAANPLDFALNAVAEEQTTYANTCFWNCNGYRVLLDVIHNTLVKKTGIIKTHRKPQFREEFFTISNVMQDGLMELQQYQDMVTIVAVEEVEGVTGLYHVEVALKRDNAKNVVESVDMTKFFVDDNATCPEDARVIGERTSITVGEALEMGLEFEGDWLELDDYDAGMDAATGEEEARRGVQKNGQPETVDLAGHRFLLTECYARFDLDGTGIPQLYRFFLGGTDYIYLAHDKVEEQPYSAANGDPMPNSFFGRSFFDILKEDQNVQTSLLRASVDNAHKSNNTRLAVHDTLVNMADVMNNAIGAPIRFRQPGMIQEIGTSSTLGALLPMLQYLRQMSELKAGVTNAAMGLDPDALQSTDKDAVRNTIQLAQGQVELFCRNLAETGISSAMAKLLRLQLRHPPRNRPVPLIYQLFDPDMEMRVSIGLGTGNLEGQIAALQQVAQKQEQIIAEYGVQNPVCTLNHMMNTIVDLGTLMGLKNMGRYFNSVTPEALAQLQQMIDAKAAAAQPEPPSVAIAIAEEIRGKAKMAERQMENEQKTADRDNNNLLQITKALMDDDFRRDQMAQDLEVESAKISGQLVNQDAVLREQSVKRDYDLGKSLLQIGASRAAQTEKLQMAQAPSRSTVPPARPQQ